MIKAKKGGSMPINIETIAHQECTAWLNCIHGHSHGMLEDKDFFQDSNALNTDFFESHIPQNLEEQVKTIKHIIEELKQKKGYHHPELEGMTEKAIILARELLNLSSAETA